MLEALPDPTLYGNQRVDSTGETLSSSSTITKIVYTHASRFPNRPITIAIARDAWDLLCLRKGNACKADSWFVARASEISELSDETVRSYLQMMLRNAIAQ